ALGSALFTLYYLLSSRRIKNQLKQIETILATATDGIHVHDKEGKLFLFSDSFAKIHGYTREEISKLRIYDLNTFFDPTKINSIMDQMKHQTLTFETKHTRKNGEMFDVEIHATEIDLDGKEYIYASLRDITQRKYSETILLQHDTILKNIAEGVYAIDNDGRCTYINPAALSLLNLKEEDILGYIPHEVFHYRHSDGETYTADECPIRNAAMQGSSTQLEDIFMRRDKSLFPVFVTVSPILQNDILIGSVVTFIDISDQKQSQNQLEAQKEHFDHMAHHDPLTGLPNRLSLIETLESITTGEQTEPFALMFLDLDGFKEINDSYGHRFGDQILIQFAQVLQNTFPMDSIIVRTGGDEFVIILSYHDNPEMMISTIQKLLNKLNCPFTINNLDIYITVSIGVTNYPEHSINAEELFQQADAAMYNAKNMGKNTFSFYDAHFTEKALQRTTISTNLKRALLDNALELYFQPQVDSHSGKIIGAEALLRWPTLEGMIPPSL
ncbi:MAG: diguanylate cyclase, partial [Sulfuricurvum sp.]|nr:diguanylate cyclase [Sulfuricurvum sp.]